MLLSLIVITTVGSRSRTRSTEVVMSVIVVCCAFTRVINLKREREGESGGALLVVIIICPGIV